MPFKTIYAVRFWNGNLHPHLNLTGWPAMQLSTPTANDLAERFPDAGGLNLRITRGLTVPAGTTALNSVYIPLAPGALSLDTRLLMRVEFDRPLAEGLPLFDHGPLGGGEIGRLAKPSPGERDPSGGAEMGREASALGMRFSIPEPWAIALNVSTGTEFPTDETVHLTCQFNRQFNGVRLNTPGSLQTDKGAPLESPLDYGIYQGGYMAFPDNTDGWVDPPIFTLEHSFCGWNAAANKHTPGNGMLRISRTWQADVVDQRVFSSNPLASIGALGVSLVTQSGVGRMSVHMRSFSIRINASV